MMKRWRAGWLFPLVLAIALGGLSAWLDRISEVTVEETALNPNEPQYKMSGMEGKRFDKQGLLQENLSAAQAWQLPKRDDVFFADPALQVFSQGKQIYQVVSQQARYNTDTRKVFFEKQVVMTKTATPDSPAGVLKTNSITIDTQTQSAHTDEPVQFQYGQSSGQSNGLSYDHNQGKLNLPSRVKAIIYDPKKP